MLMFLEEISVKSMIRVARRLCRQSQSGRWRDYFTYERQALQ